MDDDMLPAKMARLELIRKVMYLRQEAEKILRLVQRRYKKDYERRVCIAPIFRVGDYFFLARLLLFRSYTERSTNERYN